MESWIECIVSVSPEDADAVSFFLMDLGSSGIVEENEKKRGVVSPVSLISYFKDDDNFSETLKTLKQYLQNISDTKPYPLPCPARITIKNIPDEDWNKKWKSFFQPIRITDKIIIKPTWRKYREKPGETVIEIDPGMAFGTGAHPSTSMCIKAIEALLKLNKPGPARSLLDVGTGSGILAITASKLGIEKVTGIDTDHQAVLCARKNAEINRVADKISFSSKPLKKLDGKYHIVVANILPHVLINMREELLNHLEEDGCLILSGILEKKASEVEEAFFDGCRLIMKFNDDEWSCLVFNSKICRLQCG